MDLLDVARAIDATTSHAWQSDGYGFTSGTQVPAGYIWPEIESASSLDATVLLVSAAGAMGKTVASLAVAAKSRSLRLDTASVRVGDNTISGGLAKALGPINYSEFLTAFRSGQASLVVDGLDEALLFSGSEHFEAFLSDLLWILEGRGEPLAVAMFGRVDAMDTVELYLADRGVSYLRTDLMPLDLPRANDFIDTYLDAKRVGDKAYDAHRVSPKPFGELRDAIVNDIGRAITENFTSLADWSVVSSFLGYPPVLAAIAERLAVSNPSAELTGALAGRASIGATRSRGELLLEIVRQIVAREQAKVGQHLGSALGMDLNDRDRLALYTESEQITRLLALRGIIDDTSFGPEILPPADRTKYDQQIRSFLADHPFLRGRDFTNIVFSDYVHAYAASSPLAGAQLPRLDTRRFDVGPFFAHFLHALAKATSIDDEPEVLQDYVSQIVKSARLAHARCRWTYAKVGDAPGLLEVQLDDGPSGEGLRFLTPHDEDLLVIDSPLTHCDVMTSQEVLVRGVSGEIRLGPGVGIFAASIHFECEEIRVAPRRRAGHESSDQRSGFGVFLSADALIETSAKVRLHILEDDCLRVSMPQPCFPWGPYIYEPPSFGYYIAVPTWNRVVVFVRRVLSMLHPLANERVGANAELVRKLVGSSPLGSAVLAALLEIGVLEDVSTYYLLDLGELSKHEVNYSSIGGDNPHRQLEKFVSAVFATTAMKTHRE